MTIDLSTKAKLELCHDELQSTKVTLGAVNTLCGNLRKERNDARQQAADSHAAASTLARQVNELRAQVALLQAGLREIDDQLANPLIGHDTLRTIIKRAVRVTLKQTPADAAQYVRGLEAALQQILEIDDIVDGYSYDPAPHVIKHTPVEIWRIAFDALAQY